MPDVRFYDDLAEWWPPFSPPQEYGEEANGHDAGDGRGLLAGAGIAATSVVDAWGCDVFIGIRR